MKIHTIAVFLILLFITACNILVKNEPENLPTRTLPIVPVATETLLPTNPVVPENTLPITTDTLTASNISNPAATVTLRQSNTPTPSATDTANPNQAVPDYIDDRSTPSQVIVSLYNAINRKEYLRAYNYWTSPSTSQGSYAAYASGYQNTASVNLVFGQITGDAGAGQYYFTVPVILKVSAMDGTRANYAACYIVHQAQPANFGEPPFTPMGIEQGSAKTSNINSSDSSVLASACNGYPSGPGKVAASGTSLSIVKSNYLDNRSGPTETVSSFLNALNRKEYVRAYYYYQNPSTYPGPFDPYAAGYSNTDVITATFGTIRSEGAAGSLYFKVPLSLKVLTTTSSIQTYLGCYTVRLAQPAIQATPPFQPMGIIAGKFKLLTNGTDVGPLLPTTCN